MVTWPRKEPGDSMVRLAITTNATTGYRELVGRNDWTSSWAVGRISQPRIA
jgi:hypothetical protein